MTRIGRIGRSESLGGYGDRKIFGGEEGKAVSEVREVENF
jgi:hypothetical protein